MILFHALNIDAFHSRKKFGRSAPSVKTMMHNFFVGLLLFSPAAAAQSTRSGVHKVIIIADVGIDDAGALLLALGSPALDIIGVVSAFGGHGDPKVTARNAFALVNAAGRSADIPIIVGESWPLGSGKPLILDDVTAAGAFHGPDGIAGLLGPLKEETDREASTACVANETSAAEFMAQAARRHPGEVYVLCFSPLTNLAHALAIEPRL